jgi:uncharacterized protein YcnI
MHTPPRRGPRAVAPILFIFVALAATIASRCAHAHIVAQPDQGKAGSYFETSLKVPHGCDGSSTVALRVAIPDGVLSIKPQLKPGWTVSIVTRSIDPPLKAEHGMTIDKSVAAVEWRGGPLPDNLYDTFGLVMKLPTTPGKTLYFPVVQTCENGKRDWTEIPTEGQDWHAIHSPAPQVRLAPAQ